MQILTLGNPYLDKALKQLGHQTFNLGLHKATDLTLEHPVASKQLLAKVPFCPDYFCYLDDGNMPVLIDPENMPLPSVYYSIDTYCNPWHAGYAHGFDRLLVAQKSFLGIFSDSHPEAEWFPLFAPDAIAREDGDFRENYAKRDIPVAFVGTLGHKNNPDRLPFLKEFRKRNPLVMMQGDYRPVFARTKIALNQTAFLEINFRCFEAIAMGCALLMEDCGPELAEIFTPGETILPPYPRNDAAKAADIAGKWLTRPEELAELAENGLNVVRQRHTALARAKRLVEILSNMPEDIGKTRLQLAEYRRRFVRASFGMLAAELTSPQFAAHRDFFLKLAQ